MQPRRRILTAAVVLSSLACWSPPGAAQQVHEVSIRDYKFEPAVVQIKVGDTVRWTNNEKRTSHSVFFTGAESLESDRLFPGESWQRVFDKPGTYPYTCGPHPEMTGKIVVTE
jgi:plastocyanin